MKKICLIFIIGLLVILSGCGNKEQIKNNISKASSEIKENNGETTLSDSSKQKNTINIEDREKNIKEKNIKDSNYQLIKQENKKIENIDSKIKDIGWYRVDCKKYFKTLEGQRQCEEKQLTEAGNACAYYPQLGITMKNVDNYFTKKRFDLLDEEEIGRYGQICKQNLVEKQKQEEEERQKEKEMKKVEEKIKKVEEMIKNFKLSDCEKFAEKQPIGEPEYKKQFIKQCKIGYVLKYRKGDCSLLKKDGLDKECEKIKKDLDFYRRLQQEQRQYGGFDLRRLLAPDIYNQVPSGFVPAGR